MKQKTKFKETEIGMIPEDWEEKQLGEFITFQRGHDLPISQMKEGDYPVMGSNGIIGYHDDFKAKGPGVTIGRSGNIGNPFYVESDYWPHNTVLYVKNFHGANEKFVYYFLKGLRLNRFNAGSAVPTLNRNHIHPMPIIVPENIEEQKLIAKIFSVLDSKIELNQHINHRLETIGQAIFKRWFVDKEMDGEFTEGQLGDIMTLEYGKGLPKEKRESGNVPVYGSGGIYGFTEEFLVEGPGIIVGRAGCPGSVNISGKNFFPVDSTFYVNCEKEYFFYLYYMLKRLDLVRLNTGSAVPGLNRNNAYMVSIDYPDKQTAKKFNEICQHLFNKIWINQDQINGLEQIRDSLLPRLMSGKIRVPVEVTK